MGTLPTASPRIVFGSFEYDCGSGDLRKYGNRIRLQGQPLQVLAMLLERPGEVVSREELQRQIWSGAGFGDFEHGLNAAVNKLRQALGDSADQPRYVETVPGRGYRFIAPVQRSSAKPVLEMAAQLPPRMDSPRERRWQSKFWLPSLAGVALIAILAAYWLGTQSREQVRIQQSVRFTVSPPPGFVLEPAASRQGFALSPNGRRLAFTAMDTSGTFSAFVRDFHSLESRQIPGTEGTNSLFWAPDSQSLFLTARGKLRRLALDSNASAVLCDLPPRIFSGTFLDSGKLLISGGLGAHTLSSSGGLPQALPEAYRWPQLLPGGRHILHTVWDSGSRRHRARVVRLDHPSSPKDLIDSDSRVMFASSAVTPGKGYLMYIRAGNLLAQPFDANGLRLVGEATPVLSRVYSFFPTGAADFSVSENGVLAYQSYVSRSRLAWVDRQGRELSAIGPENVNVKSGRLSPDEQRLAAAIYDIERGGQNLWVFNTRTGAGRLLTPEPGLRDAPVWAPDSKRLAFLNAFGDKPPGIAIREIQDSDSEQLLPRADFQMPTDWSLDGRFLAFINTGTPRFENQTQSDVWVVDLAGGHKLWPVLSTPFHEANPAFSPDGKWLAFTSNESGRPEVYIQSFAATPSPRVTGDRHLASRSGALVLRWRRDGKELYYLGFDGRVHAVRLTLSQTPEFGPDQPLFTIRMEARAAAPSVIGFDVSPDGNRFVIPIVTSQESSSLIVVQNWEAELPRQRSH